jgi:hypothetical protein
LQLALGGFGKCLTATIAAADNLTTAKIEAVTCAGTVDAGTAAYQSWAFNADGTLGVVSAGGHSVSICLTGSLKDGGPLGLATCNATDVHQKWGKHDNAEVAENSPAVGGAVSPPSLTEAVLLDTVVSFKGTQQHPVKYVTLEGVRIAHAATTQLKQYEVPSGGDWAVGRYGAVTVEGAVGVTVSDCFFDSVGGNGVLLNNYAKNNTIARNRISFPGDSGVVATGSSNMVDGTGDTYPSFNLVENNWIHDIGIYGKAMYVGSLCM